ncbi:hypothetical protein [Duganella guangzhouensis]|uniref:hypothetical protein n=1 Tax=Duganella guangzhouensis TaxID=2666084 RepID=UPI001E4ECB11|nr:hypothetical protein [Duganella guangzhouensis]
MTPSVNPVAQAQAAAHRTALLLERCRHTPFPPASLQAQWHAAQQAAFLAWLEAGGFAQPTNENSGITPLFPAPQGT